MEQNQVSVIQDRRKIIFFRIFISVIAVTFWAGVVYVGYNISTFFNSDTSVTTDFSSQNYEEEYLRGNSQSQNKFLEIPINGLILSQEGTGDGLGSIFQGESLTYGYSVKEQLLNASKDSSISGIVLNVNSPGGGVTGSQAIADGVIMYKERTKKPVYVFVDALSASGAVFGTVPADKIFAERGSLIGSIGVIVGEFFYYDTVKSVGSLFDGTVGTDGGITYDVITAGRGKDLGNPFRAVTEEERAILQKTADRTYDHFVNHVALHRHIAPDLIRNEIGAHVYGEDQAVEFGLIDGVLSRDGVYERLADSLGFSHDDYNVVTYTESLPSLAEIFLMSRFQNRLISEANILSNFCHSKQNVVLAYHGDITSYCH